jgi:hypothetical protein
MTPTPNINKHTYKLTLSNTHNYILRIFNFAVVSTLLTLIKLKLSIVAVSSAILNSNTNLKISKLTITNIFSELDNLLTNLSLRKISISTAIQETGIIFTTLSLRKISIGTALSQIMTMITNVNAGFVHFTLAPIVATLRLLSVFDPQTLSTLDGGTLAFMDHS